MKRPAIHPAIKAIAFTPAAASTASVGNKHANNEFIGACLEFDQLLAHLTTLRNDHFGVDPERERNWGEVGSVREGVRMLTEAVAFLTPARPVR
jgi:hypothetical protein